MAQRDILKDTTSFIGKVFLRDSTTGLGKTGVAAASMSGDYCKDDNSADVALSFATGSVGDAYSSGKWAEIGNGFYFYHYPNGCWDTFGETGFSFRASGAIDAAPKFRVVAIDPEDADAGGMAYLDEAVSAAKTLTSGERSSVAAAVRTNLAVELARIDENISAAKTLTTSERSSIATAVRTNLATELGRIDENVSAAKTLTSGAIDAIATATEAAIFDDGDSTALLTAIANTVEQFILNDGDSQATLAAIGTAVRTALATELARIDENVSAAKTLTVAYDSAKTAASATALASAQASLDAAAIVAAATKAIADKLDTALEGDGAAGWQFTTLALANAPSGGGGGGDATLANQAIIVTHLTDIKGSGWTSAASLENLAATNSAVQITGVR